MRHPHGYVYWDMPSSYSIGETHPDLLRLTAELLLYPWFPSMRTDFEKTRSKGRQISLSFSAGIDSTAAMLVMPQSTLLLSSSVIRYNSRSSKRRSVITASSA